MASPAATRPEIADEYGEIRHAASALVDARDGLTWVLSHLAELTAGEDEEKSVRQLARVLGALPQDERRRLAEELAELGSAAHGPATQDRDPAAEDNLLELAERAARRVLAAIVEAGRICPAGVA